MPRKQEIFANKPKSKHFKLHFSIYNSIAFAGEKPSQNSHRFVFASLRGREPSQSSHKFVLLRNPNSDFPYGKDRWGRGGKNQFGKHRLPNFAAA